MLRGARGAKEEPHGPGVNGSAEVHLVGDPREALESGKRRETGTDIGLLTMMPTGAG